MMLAKWFFFFPKLRCVLVWVADEHFGWRSKEKKKKEGTMVQPQLLTGLKVV